MQNRRMTDWKVTDLETEERKTHYTVAGCYYVIYCRFSSRGAKLKQKHSEKSITRAAVAERCKSEPAGPVRAPGL